MVSCPGITVFSDVFSTISLCSWICAQIPQIYTNFKNKSTDAISPAFLLLWFTGDFLSFTSCLLNDVVLEFQLYLSLFFLSNDVILIFQYYYYTFKMRKTTVLAAYTSLEVSPDPVVDNSTQPKGFIKQKAPEEIATSYETARTLTGDQNPMESIEISRSTGSDRTLWNNAIGSLGLGAVLNLPGTLALSLASASVSLAKREDSRLGSFLAWGCAVVYMGSRCPQLYKNYCAKNVEGISPLLFGAALLGNVTYSISIVMSCKFLNADDKGAFILKELPYILGSAGTVVFDFGYFYQRHIYRTPERAHSTALQSIY